MIGKTIAHYHILEKLGEGGMGVVYKARDTHLDRLVALKVLPPEKVADSERKRRFVQEAKAASALNHPNIITIHDIASEHGIDFIVMEYVQGKTLDALVPRKGLRLNETLKLSIQMSDALATAHSAGIVHRDLKPTNVMVTEAGLVKVLDFGLAKLTEISDSDDASTLTQRAETEEGTIVGTVSYMSPEQAEGKKVDARSDIFSFGSVLYEMATGQQAFHGDSKMSTLAAILNKDPKPVLEVSTAVPRELDRIINHCLRKDPRRRFQHMEDLKVELEELKEESDSGTLAGAPAATRPARRPWVWVAVAIVLVAIAVAGWLFRGGHPGKPQAAPEVVPLTSYAGLETSPSFSPDGNQVAFSWNGEKQDNFDIYLKLIGSQNYVRLTTNSAEDSSPAFSPDGRSIGFIRVSNGHASFIVIPAIGGPERIVGDLPDAADRFLSFAWLPDGKCVVTNGLALLSVETGERRSLTSSPAKSLIDFGPAISPDGRTIAFGRAAGWMNAETYLLNLTEELKPKGEPRRMSSLMSSYGYGSAWLPNGQEIILSATGAHEWTGLWRVAVSGAREPEQLALTGQWTDQPAISKSGSRLAYVTWNFDTNIWRLSLSGPGEAAGPPTNLIASTRWETAPQYSPDGKRIAFESMRTGVYGIWTCDADGSSAVELFSRPGAHAGTARWSPDGQRIAFDFDPDGNTDVYVVRAGGGKLVRLTNDAASEEAPSWSRDGHWVYFASRRSGRWETWKVPAEGGEAVQVTRNGGGTAFESLDGQSVYYMIPGKNPFSGSLWEMPVGGGEARQLVPSVVRRAFSAVKDGIYFIPETATDGKPYIQFLSFVTGKITMVAPVTNPSEGLSVSPDGRFLLFSQGDEGGSDLMLVENFR